MTEYRPRRIGQAAARTQGATSPSATVSSHLGYDILNTFLAPSLNPPAVPGPRLQTFRTNTEPAVRRGAVRQLKASTTASPSKTYPRPAPEGSRRNFLGSVACASTTDRDCQP